MSLHARKNRLQYSKNNAFYGKMPQAAISHLQQMWTSSSLAMCTLYFAWKLRVFERNYYCSLLTQIHWYHDQFPTPQRRYQHLLIYQSHVGFLTMVCGRPQTHLLWDSKVRSPLSLERSCTRSPLMNPVRQCPVWLSAKFCHLVWKLFQTEGLEIIVISFLKIKCIGVTLVNKIL